MRRTHKSLVLLLLVIPVLWLGWATWKRVQPAAQAPAADSVDVNPATSPRADSPAAQVVLRDDLARQMELMKDPLKAQQVQEQQLAQLESQHRAERVEAGWKAQAESALSDIATSRDLEMSGIAPSTYASDCRSSTCRTSATFSTHGDAQDWGTMFLTMSGTTVRQARLMVLPNADGTYELRVYGTRR